MNRINKLFQSKKQNIFSIYFTAGFPALIDTFYMIQELDKAGVDMIEIGMENFLHKYRMSGLLTRIQFRKDFYIWFPQLLLPE